LVGKKYNTKNELISADLFIKYVLAIKKNEIVQYKIWLMKRKTQVKLTLFYSYESSK